MLAGGPKGHFKKISPNFEKAKMSDALNRNISIDRIASSYFPFPRPFFQHLYLFYNAGRKQKS